MKWKEIISNYRSLERIFNRMTSGTSSPTPTDSPSLCQRPLLTANSIQPVQKKTVEFEPMPTRNGSEEVDRKNTQDPER